jgi:hypothetical protein
MMPARFRALLTLLALYAAPMRTVLAAERADLGGVGAARTPFVIGAPGRLDSEGDRREPRLYPSAESLVAAYADVETVRDATWLRHEVEHYARRAVDCAGMSPPWCGRAVRRLGSARVIALTAGAHAELVWFSGRGTAVRLGWQRLVQSPTGTMTVDDPPAAFAAALLAKFPSRVQRFDTDQAHDAGWRADEIDRLLYYADQVLAGIPTVAPAAHRQRAVEFVEQALAEIDRLRRAEPTSDSASPEPGRDVAERLALIREWRARRLTPPWCAAELVSSVERLPLGP